MRVDDLTAQNATALGIDPPRGVLVVQIVPEGAADAAGLVVGDIILSLAKRTVSSAATLRDFGAALPPGQSVPMTIWRRRDKVTLTIVPHPAR